MAMCKWCYSYTIEYAEQTFQYQKEYTQALDWLGIKEKDICRMCMWHILWETERVSAGFHRPYNVHITKLDYMKYSTIADDMRVLGWCAFLQDHLREMTSGRYFKIRKQRYEDKMSAAPANNHDTKS